MTPGRGVRARQPVDRDHDRVPADPAPVLAAAFVAAARAEGLEPDPGLALLAAPGATARTARPIQAVSGPGDLGLLHERLVTGEDRTRRGAWYTPAWLAEELVARVLPDRAAAELGPVVDPACGGGVFLLAAADRLRALGWAGSEVLARLRGSDVDATAVAVTEAALWWWSARAGAPTRPRHLTVADALLSPCARAAGAVVGNPPFLGQLRSATTVDADRRSALRARFGDAVRPYTDPAWLFVLDAVEQVVPGGRVALVQPQSFLAARDAGAVRERIDRGAELEHTVVDDGTAFDAAVSVCAPVLRRRAAGPCPGNDWVRPLADATGVPHVDLRAHGVLGEIATLHAGFRDEYYGLTDAVREADGDPGGHPRLVTAGAIDPLRVLDRPQRFAGRRWQRPVVDVSALGGRAARWAAVQDGPKVLVATQTRVLESVADPTGALLGSVPVLCIRPNDPADLWRVLAALQAPAASAWLFRRSAGTALSAGACRPTAALLSTMPVPSRGAAWDDAAAAARAASELGDPADVCAALADRAYGVTDPVLTQWWTERRPRR